MFVSPSLLYDRAGIDHGALGDGLILANHADLPFLALNVIAHAGAGLDMAALGDDGAADNRTVSMVTSGMITLSVISTPLPTVQPVEIMECVMQPSMLQPSATKLSRISADFAI